MKTNEKIKHLREAKNYTQSYVATQLNITQKAYSKIESGETKLSVDHLILISNALEIPLAEILSKGTNSMVYLQTEQGAIDVKSISEKLTEVYERLLKAKDLEINQLKRENKLLANRLRIPAKNLQKKMKNNGTSKTEACSVELRSREDESIV